MEVTWTCDMPIVQEGGYLTIVWAPHKPLCWGTKQSFVDRFGLGIPLGEVWTWLYLVDTIFQQLLNVGIDESTIVGKYSFGNAELINDIVADKVS